MTTAATRADVRRRGFAIPSWVVFGMVILATFALCVTVTMRTHAEMRSAEQKFEQMNVEVENLRRTNQTIERQVERLRTDPRAIEAAARTQLNMVRADEIVVPVE
jgi:cell division protein FtsB